MLKVIDVALAEVGYLEKETNAQLDSDTGNAGDENYTKYARDLHKITGFYNGNKNGFAWCDVFVDWCFVTAYGVELARKLLNHGQLGAGVNYSAQYYKDAGRWHTSPQVGDQIFFKSGSSKWAHTGLVVEVTGSKVITVEGNTSGASGVVANGGGVCKKTYALNFVNIVGYGRPDYSLVNETTETKQKVSACSVELPVLSKGNEGDSVKALQILLIGNGFSCGSAGADGDFGSGTLTAVKKYQRAKKLDDDGVVGEKTWTALLK